MEALEAGSTSTCLLPFRGLNTSLYSSLPKKAVKDIELAISYKLNGRVNESRELFEDPSRLGKFKNVAVVAIEHADLELEFGKWGAAWRILNEKLEYMRKSGEDSGSPESRLVSLTWAMLGTRHRGDVINAVREIERTQRWLENVPVSEYTDVQTSCVRRYVITYYLTKLNTNYNNEEAEHIPKAETTSLPSVPWRGLHDLRRSLCHRGMYYEANALFRVELNRTPMEHRMDVVTGFLASVEHLQPIQGHDFIEASTRLQLADFLAQLELLPWAKEELGRTEAAFNRYCNYFNVTTRDTLSLWHALEYTKLICMETNTDEDIDLKLRRAKELGGILERVGSAKTGVCFSTAATVAELAYDKTLKQSYKDCLLDCWSRIEKYDEYWTEDLCDMAQNRVQSMSRTMTEFVEQEHALEWINGFLEKYNYFSPPSVLIALFKRKHSLLLGLRRLEEAARIGADVDELEHHAPELGKWLKPGTMPDGLGNESADFLFFLPWKSFLENIADRKDTSMNILCAHLLDDVSAKRLLYEDLADILGVPYTEIHSEESIKLNGTRILSSIVFPSIDGFDKVQNERSFDRICEWLEKPPAGQQFERLFSLLMIRSERQSHFESLKLWDARIRELEALLRLEENIPVEVRAQAPYIKGLALGGLALSWHAKLEQMGNPTSDDARFTVSQTLSYNQRALELFQKQNYRSQVSIHQRIGAYLCLVEVLRLSNIHGGDIPPDSIPPKPSTDPQKETVEEVRLRGLDMVRAADVLYSEVTSHASSNEGSRGVIERSNVAEFHSNARHIHIAISLLLSGLKCVEGEHQSAGPCNTDIISEIWSWVQMYKARSLAEAIGINSPDPPGLQNKLLSETARAAYKKMKDLDDQIKGIHSSEFGERFHLRRQLDAHIKAMKNDPQLRQLLDLKAAGPMNFSELEKIGTRVGSPVVLIDWFYLSPFDRNSSGKLLLFTAKAGCTTPTMDVVGTDWNDLLRWHTWYHQDEPLEPFDSIQFDHELHHLVEPLSRHTQPVDVLILCPTFALHRLPLHALTIREEFPTDPEACSEQPLIQRNPVVYTYSHSLLRLCLNSADQAWDSPAPVNPTFLSGIPESQSEGYKIGRNGIKALAQRFQGTLMMEDEAAKEKVLQRASESRMLHLHTHCVFKPLDPLQHYLEFPKKRALLGETENPVDILTAREVFDLRLQAGTHVNLIACTGGLTSLKPGDEVLGMVPALLYSGACSILSTLKPIEDRYGQAFSEYFFEALTQQHKKHIQTSSSVRHRSDTMEAAELAGAVSGSVWFADIARAVQYATLKLYDPWEGLEGLEKWAPFILHGFWKFPMLEKDAWLNNKLQDQALRRRTITIAARLDGTIQPK